MKKITDEQIKNEFDLLDKETKANLKNWLSGTAELKPFIYEPTQKIDYAAAREHFLNKYPRDEFTIHRQDKQSGDDNLLIWRDVLLISCGDFMSTRHTWEKEFMRGEWKISKTRKALDGLVKKLYGGDVNDKRRRLHEYKPTANNLQERIEAIIIGS